MTNTQKQIYQNCLRETDSNEQLTPELVDSFMDQVIRRHYGKLGWYMSSVAPLIYNKKELRPEVFVSLLFSFGSVAVDLVNDLVKFFDEYDIKIEPKKKQLDKVEEGEIN